MAKEQPTDLSRQAKDHLASLEAAGVRFLPKAAAPKIRRKTAVSMSEGVVPPQPPRDSLDTRKISLQLLAEAIKVCMKCPELIATRANTVFGVGPLNPDLCFVGEAPGADEDRQGEPFVGAAGQLLNKIIEACGMKREDVYICNTIKCRPPGNRTPKPEETANCRAFFEEQIALVRPKFICALGGTAAQALLGVNAPIGKLRGQFHDFNGIPVLCTYHPAFLLPHRSPAKKKDVWEDMQLLLKRMGRPIPPTKKSSEGS